MDKNEREIEKFSGPSALMWRETGHGCPHRYGICCQHKVAGKLRKSISVTVSNLVRERKKTEHCVWWCVVLVSSDKKSWDAKSTTTVRQVLDQEPKLSADVSRTISKHLGPKRRCFLSFKQYRLECFRGIYSSRFQWNLCTYTSRTRTK